MKGCQKVHLSVGVNPGAALVSGTVAGAAGTLRLAIDVAISYLEEEENISFYSSRETKMKNLVRVAEKKTYSRWGDRLPSSSRNESAEEGRRGAAGRLEARWRIRRRRGRL